MQNILFHRFRAIARYGANSCWIHKPFSFSVEIVPFDCDEKVSPSNDCLTGCVSCSLIANACESPFSFIQIQRL